MSVYKTIIKYATDTQPFVGLVSKRRLAFERIFTARFNIGDYEVRDTIRTWARRIENIGFSDGDFSPLMEEIFGELIELILSRAITMFPPKKIGRGRKNQIDRDIDNCFNEYMAIDIVIDVLKQCFGNNVIKPSPEVILNAAIILKTRPSEARNFLYHARMPSLDVYYKPSGM